MTPEGRIKKDITDALKTLGYIPYRIQCGRWRVRGGWMHGAADGTPDLLVPVMLGEVKGILWIETKTADGKLRAKQQDFRDTLKPFEYHIEARSLDDVLDWLKKVKAHS